MMFKDNDIARYVAACFVTSAWMVVSSLLILLNKHLMSVKGFSYPMAMSSLGQMFSAVAATICCWMFKLGDRNRQISARYYAFKIMPIGFFMAVTLMTGNAVYLHLSVAFIQMLKAFTPVFTMVGLFLAALEVPTCNLIVSVVIITVGTAIAAYGEIHFSIIGVILMTVSESAEALRLIMTQIMLQGLNFHPIEGVMYLAPACVVWMILGVWFGEWQRMVDENAWSVIEANSGLFMVAASLGFVCNALVFFTIELCGSLTLKVLGTTKNAALVLFCVVFLGEQVTSLQGVGFTIALAGFAWYQYIKLKPPQPGNTSQDAKEALARQPSTLESIPLVKPPWMASELLEDSIEDTSVAQRHTARLAGS